MAVFLLAWELGGGSGHCVNLLPIAEHLTSRGHEVFAAVRDLHAARRVFVDLPIRYLQGPALRQPPSPPPRPARTFADILHAAGFSDDHRLDPLAAAWRTLFELVRPAAIVCEHSPTALLASRGQPMKRAALGIGFNSPPDVSPTPDLAPWLGSADNAQLIACEQAVLDRMKRWLAAHDAPPLDRIGQLFSEVDENFVCTLAEVDHYGPWRTAKYWGAWSPLGGRVPHWPPGEGPRLFAYIHSPAPRWRPEVLLETLASLGYPSIVYAPWLDPSLVTAEPPPNMRIETLRLDIHGIARECQIAVTHGNNGVCTHMLLAGVPQLHLPLYMEQAVFARRCAALGLSLYADPDRRDEISSRLLSLVQDPAYRQAARMYADRYANLDPQASAHDIAARIERLACE